MATILSTTETDHIERLVLAGAPDLALRPRLPSDDGFLFELFVDVRRPEFEQAGLPEALLNALLADQYRIQALQYAAAHPGAEHRIIEHDGTPVGRLILAQVPEGLRIVDISLMSNVRGRGLGGRVLSWICEQAGAAGCSVSLSVLGISPAQTLYLRHGFRFIDAGEPYRQMVRPRPIA